LNHALARILYIIEFFLALLASITLWSQVGGQTHLDLMPWYLKLSLSLAMAAASVKATVAATAHHTWNRRTISWLAVVILLGIVMGMITYYYHLIEPRDEDDNPQVALLMRNFIQP
jgi:hypothetical protein